MKLNYKEYTSNKGVTYTTYDVSRIKLNKLTGETTGLKVGDRIKGKFVFEPIFNIVQQMGDGKWKSVDEIQTIEGQDKPRYMKVVKFTLEVDSDIAQTLENVELNQYNSATFQIINDIVFDDLKKEEELKGRYIEFVNEKYTKIDGTETTILKHTITEEEPVLMQEMSQEESDAMVQQMLEPEDPVDSIPMTETEKKIVDKMVQGGYNIDQIYATLLKYKSEGKDIPEVTESRTKMLYGLVKGEQE